MLKPTIVALRQKVRGTREAELERTLPRLSGVTERERRSLDKMIDAMTNKLLHRTISELKSHADTPEGEALLRHARLLYELEDAKSAPQPEPTSDGVQKKLAPAKGKS